MHPAEDTHSGQKQAGAHHTVPGRPVQQPCRAQSQVRMDVATFHTTHNLRSGNTVADWSSVAALASFASLTELRIRDNPFAAGGRDLTVRQCVIASLPRACLDSSYWCA